MTYSKSAALSRENKSELVVLPYAGLELICARGLIWRKFVAMDVQERI